MFIFIQVCTNVLTWFRMQPWFFGERLLCVLSVTLLLGNFLTLRVTKFKQLGNVVVTIKPWKLILSVGEHCQSHRKRLFVWDNRALTTALQKFKSSLPIQLSKRQKKYKWFKFFFGQNFLFITRRHRCAHSILLLCYATLYYSVKEIKTQLHQKI